MRTIAPKASLSVRPFFTKMQKPVFASIAGNFGSIFSSRRDELTIDCGSSFTRIYLGKRLVFDEPTAVAVQMNSGLVLVVGKEAQALIGKTPAGIKVVFPMENGRVAHPEFIKTFFQAVLGRTILGGVPILQRLFGLRGSIGLPAAATPVESQLYKEILHQSGLEGLKLESGITGSFVSVMGQKSKASESCCVMSIGGQTTQVGVFSAGRLAYESRWSWGGVKFTEIIQNIMRQEEQLAVSWHAAEAIKLELPSLQSDKAHNSKVAIRGKDIINQSSKTKIVNISIFAQAFAEYYAELLENFELFVSELPTELATACLENGIYLTGGGSKIVDLSDHLSKRMHTIVRVHANPELATAQGLVKMSQS